MAAWDGNRAGTRSAGWMAEDKTRVGGGCFPPQTVEIGADVDMYRCASARAHTHTSNHRSVCMNIISSIKNVESSIVVIQHINKLSSGGRLAIARNSYYCCVCRL